MAVVMPTTNSLKLKGIARKHQKHGLCCSFSMIPALYLFGSRKDDSRRSMHMTQKEV